MRSGRAAWSNEIFKHLAVCPITENFPLEPSNGTLLFELIATLRNQNRLNAAQLDEEDSDYRLIKRLVRYAFHLQFKVIQTGDFRIKRLNAKQSHFSDDRFVLHTRF